jgi:hypothetical protein
MVWPSSVQNIPVLVVDGECENVPMEVKLSKFAISATARVVIPKPGIAVIGYS